MGGSIWGTVNFWAGVENNGIEARKNVKFMSIERYRGKNV
jgi:hypothetical protein